MRPSLPVSYRLSCEERPAAVVASLSASSLPMIPMWDLTFRSFVDLSERALCSNDSVMSPSTALCLHIWRSCGLSRYFAIRWRHTWLSVAIASSAVHPISCKATAIAASSALLIVLVAPVPQGLIVSSICFDGQQVPAPVRGPASVSFFDPSVYHKVSASYLNGGQGCS